jgi:hypothetical protein
MTAYLLTTTPRSVDGTTAPAMITLASIDAHKQPLIRYQPSQFEHYDPLLCSAVLEDARLQLRPLLAELDGFGSCDVQPSVSPAVHMAICRDLRWLQNSLQDAVHCQADAISCGVHVLALAHTHYDHGIGSGLSKDQVVQM